MKKGRFIVFEGLDGSGKSTHIKLLAERLRADGRKVFLTAEPTDGPIGRAIREAIGGGKQKSEWEMALLFAADRVSHNTETIEKYLAEGYDVICDRYYYSSLAYQGSEIDFNWVSQLNLGCSLIRRPDACVYLDLSPEACKARIDARVISGESDGTDIYERVERLTRYRKRFFDVFDALKKQNGEKIFIVSTDCDKTTAADEIYRAVSSLGTPIE